MSVLDELDELIPQLREKLGRIPIAELPGLAMRDYECVCGLPDVSAVYFLASESRGLLYIGKATNLWQRWAPQYEFLDRSRINWDLTHRKLRDAVDLGDVTIRWWAVPRDYLSMLESLLIQHHRPPWNTARG